MPLWGTRGLSRKNLTAGDAYGARQAPLRLMLACDRLSATQQIHLLRPLARRVESGALRWGLIDEAYASQAGAHGLAQLFDRIAPHALLFSRFAGAEASALCDLARARGAPIITHLDDYLLGVPDDVGAAKAARHSQPERLAALRTTLETANLLYISTEPLSRKLRDEGFSAPAIVATLQSCVDPEEIAPHPTDTGTIRIGYQGTSSHGPDLAMIAPALVSALEARPSATLTLFGTIQAPAELAALGSRVRTLPPARDYAHFLQRLRREAWHIGLAPLRDTPFNAFRTYTKWTEYSAAGAAVLASESPAYSAIIAGGAGRTIAKSAWRDALLDLIDNSVARRSLCDRAQAKLRTELTLEHQEVQLMSMLRSAGVSA